jgi:hypothetical protein
MDKNGTCCSPELKSSIDFIESRVTGLHQSLASVHNNLSDRQTIQLSMLAKINKLKDSLVSIQNMMYDRRVMNNRHSHGEMGHNAMVRQLCRHNINPTSPWSQVFVMGLVVGIVDTPRMCFALGQHTPVHVTITRAIGDGVNMYDPKAIEVWLYDITKSSTFIFTHQVLVIVSEIICALFHLHYD